MPEPSPRDGESPSASISRFFQEDSTAKRWMEHQMNEVMPKMVESAMVLQTLTPHEGRDEDPAFWLQLGAAIMLEKPVIAMVFEGANVPEKLRLIADEIVEIPEDGIGPEAGERMKAAIKRVTDRLDAEEA